MTAPVIQGDPHGLSMTITAELDASPERAWQLWADPRQFERWWGAPGYPATATALDLRPGGTVEYYLTGPDGEKTPANVWAVVEADRPRLIVVRDAIVNADDVPVDEGASGVTVTFERIAADRTRMSIQMDFPNAAALEMALKMDMNQILAWNVAQMESILTESAVAA